MNFRRPQTILIQQVRRMLREPGKLLEQWEVQLKQPAQLRGGNPETASEFPGNHWEQSEETRLRSVTARFSLPSDEQKTQTLLREQLRKPIGIVKQLPSRSGSLVESRKQKEDQRRALSSSRVRS